MDGSIETYLRPNTYTVVGGWGIYFNLRLDDDRQCVLVLVIIGARTDGKKEIVAIMDGFRESKLNWQSLIRELKRLGLSKGPKLAIGDGSLGFWSALDEEFPETEHQICWIHKTANVLDKLPQSLQSRAKTMIHNIYLSPTKKEADITFDIFIEEFDAKYPKAVAWMRNNREKLLIFYNYPAQQWIHLRSTNVIESTFSTVRLRTVKSKGCGSRIATLTMVFKLILSAQNKWSRLRGHRKIKQAWDGVKFEDGVMVKEPERLEEITL